MCESERVRERESDGNEKGRWEGRTMGRRWMEGGRDGR